MEKDDLFRGVMGSYTLILGFPAAVGHNEARSCLDLFDKLGYGLFVAAFRNDVRSDEYKDVVNY